MEAAIYAAWLGLHVTVGYVVAPVLFMHLPKMQAGNLAGELFHIVSYISLANGLLLIILGMATRQAFLKTARFVFIIISMLLVVVSEFLLTPVIVALKTGTMDALLLNLVNNTNFGFWHGISQLVYMATAAVVLIHFFMWTQTLIYRKP